MDTFRILSKSLFLAMVFLGCTTISTEFEEGANPEIYFQRAQRAVDINDFDTALRIYRKFLDSGINDLYYVISAEYEIAFLYYKMEKKQESIEAFEKLLRTYYDDPVDESRVPVWPKVLSQRLLQKMKGQPQTP